MDGSTGDLKNNLMKLIREARRMKLQMDANIQGLTSGCPNSLLLLIHASLMHYSLPLANWLTKHNYDLYSKSDLRFLQELYRVLRDVFNYKPKLSKEQFLSSCGYVERKILFTTHVLLLCQAKHSELIAGHSKTKKRTLRASNHGNNRCAVHEQPSTRSHDTRQAHVKADQSTEMTSTISTCMETPHPLFSGQPLSSNHTHMICTTPPKLISPVREVGLTTHAPTLSPHSLLIPVIQRHDTSFQIKPTSSPNASSQPPSIMESWYPLPEENHPSESRVQIEDVSYQIDGLREVVEKMSAKLVLLETQLKMVDSQGEISKTQSNRKESGSPRDRERCLVTDLDVRDRSQFKQNPLERSNEMHNCSGEKQATRFQTTLTSQLITATPCRKRVYTPRPPAVHAATPTTPEDMRQLIESLRVRAKKTKEFLQQVNFQPSENIQGLENVHLTKENIHLNRTNC